MKSHCDGSLVLVSQQSWENGIRPDIGNLHFPLCMRELTVTTHPIISASVPFFLLVL
jgi:hypothetical protein